MKGPWAGFGLSERSRSGLGMVLGGLGLVVVVFVGSLNGLGGVS